MDKAFLLSKWNSCQIIKTVKQYNNTEARCWGFSTENKGMDLSAVRLRHKLIRYRFLAIMLVLAVGSLSSCQHGAMQQATSAQGDGVPLSGLKSSAHAVLHVPQ
jgi:hypothetical protein